MVNAEELSAQSGPDALDFDAAFERARLDMVKAGVLMSAEDEDELQSESTGDQGESDDSDDEDADAAESVDDDGEDDEDSDSDEEDDDEDEDADGADVPDVATDEDPDESTEDQGGEAEAAEDAAEEEAEPGKRKRGRNGRTIVRLKDQLKQATQKATELETNLSNQAQFTQKLQAALAARDAAQADEDARIKAEVEAELGGPELYKETLKLALNGDFEASDKIKDWDAKQDVYERIQRRAEATVHERAGQVFDAATKDLPGIDQRIIQGESLYNIVRHVYFTGLASGRGETAADIEKSRADSQAKLDKLGRENERLKAKLSASQAKRVSRSAPTPISGGKPAAAGPKKSILDGLLDPITGMPTDESEMLIRTGRLKLLEAS